MIPQPELPFKWRSRTCHATVEDSNVNYSTPICSIVLWTLLVGAAVAAPTVKITAKEADGTEIRSFEAMLAVGDQRHTRWRETERGMIQFSDFDLRNRQSTDKDSYVGAAEVFIRAPGYATASRAFVVSEDRTEIDLELQEGRIVVLKFRDDAGREIPEDLQPLLFPEAYRDCGGRRWQHTKEYRSSLPQDENWYPLTRKDAGAYEVRVTDDTPPLFVNIDDHDFLRCFEFGPVDVAAAKGTAIDIALPKTASLTARFAVPPEVDIEKLPIKSSRIMLTRSKTGSLRSAYSVVNEELKIPDSEFSISNLAPGPIRLVLSTVSRNEVGYEEPDPGKFRDFAAPVLQPGDRRQVVFQYKPFSERPYAGDQEVSVRVLDQRSEPVEDATFEVSYSHLHFGEFIVMEGILSAGKIHLAGLSPTKDLQYPQRYSLVVNGRTIGRFAVDSAPSEKQTLSFRMAPDVGDAAISITAVDLEVDLPAKVNLLGKVTLLEFWATWCGPCQLPMQKLNKLAKEHRDEWGGRVQLIAISIDEDVDGARRHLEAHDWRSTRNLIDAALDRPVDEGVAFGSVTAADYLINGVPTALLIDQQGKIVYRGHPSSLDLVAEVERLLRK